jgi:hypothetical protein
MTRERETDWQEEYADEAEEAAIEAVQEDGPVALRRPGTKVYLVMECGWEYNDSFYENSSDGITLCAFRSRQMAINFAERLFREGKLQHWEIVERILEDEA